MFQLVTRRSFAAAAAAKTKVPVKVHGHEGRYASALYVAAGDAKLLEKVEAELAAISTTITKNAGFASYLKNPSIAREDKVSTLLNIFSADKFSNPTRNLLQTMAGNGRLGMTTKVIASFEELMEASRGVVKATVITAEALSAANAKSAAAAVGNMVEKGSKVDVVYKVDPAIIGGMQIQVGDKFMDLSVANRINAFKAEMDSA